MKNHIIRFSIILIFIATMLVFNKIGNNDNEFKILDPKIEQSITDKSELEIYLNHTEDHENDLDTTDDYSISQHFDLLAWAKIFLAKAVSNS